MKLQISRYIFLLISLILFFMGIWFVLVRPKIVLLVEDQLFTRLSPSELKQMHPLLFQWIGLVFRSWGAFIIGSGTFMGFLGWYGIARKHQWAWAGLAMGGLLTLSIFLIINIMLHGHYVWLIGVLYFLLISGLIMSFSAVFNRSQLKKDV